MKSNYRIFKTLGTSGHLVNDSEGIPMEWETYDEAKKIADLFQSNSLHGYTYMIINPTIDNN
jgi:hypothetical protein